MGNRPVHEEVNRASSSSATDITVISQSSPGFVTPAITVTSPERGLVWQKAFKGDQEGVSDSEYRFQTLHLEKHVSSSPISLTCHNLRNMLILHQATKELHWLWIAYAMGTTFFLMCIIPIMLLMILAHPATGLPAVITTTSGNVARSVQLGAQSWNF